MSRRAPRRLFGGMAPAIPAVLRPRPRLPQAARGQQTDTPATTMRDPVRTLVLTIVTLLCLTPVTGRTSERSGPPPGATQSEIRLWAMQQWEAGQRDPSLRAAQERQLADYRRTHDFFAGHAARQRSRNMRFRLLVSAVSLGSLVAYLWVYRAARRKPAAPPRSSTPVFFRRTPNPKLAEAGQERATFLERVTIVLGADTGSPDPGKPLQDGGYGCDELDVSEIVQLAEEIWAVQLNPNPMTFSDFEAMVRRFPTLEAIMREAESAAAQRRPRSCGRPASRPCLSPAGRHARSTGK
jgi:hypothetical protein